MAALFFSMNTLSVIDIYFDVYIMECLLNLHILLNQLVALVFNVFFLCVLVTGLFLPVGHIQVLYYTYSLH